MEGTYSTYEGVLRDGIDDADLQFCDARKASIAVYVFADRMRSA